MIATWSDSIVSRSAPPKDRYQKVNLRPSLRYGSCVSLLPGFVEVIWPKSTPCFVIATSNQPAGTFPMAKLPVLPVVVCKRSPVSRFRALASAFGTTAPEGSVTLPIRPPYKTWALRRPARRTAMTPEIQHGLEQDRAKKLWGFVLLMLL